MAQSTTKFKRIDLGKDGQSVSFSFEQSATSKEGGLIESDCKKLTVHKGPHKDFSNTFIKMIPHLLYACFLTKVTITNHEWFNENKFLEDERFEGITVTGIQIVDKDESKIRLIGRKTTPHGDVIPLNSPIVDLHDDGPDRYMLQSILADHFKNLMAEAELYWSKQKYAPNPQQELELV